MTTANVLNGLPYLTSYTVLKYIAEDERVVASRNTLRQRLQGTLPSAVQSGDTTSFVDLTTRVSALSINDTAQFTGGTASLTLVMHVAEYAKYVAKDVAVNAKEVSGAGDYASLIKLGDFIHIKRNTETLFLGVITSLTAREEVQPDGILATIVNLGCSNYMYLFSMSQLRLTPVGDNLKGSPELSDILTKLDTGAIAQYGDARSGFLKALIDSFEKNSTKMPVATLLARVLSALGHYRLPAALGGGRLGDNLVVLDGGVDSFRSFHSSTNLGDGNDADVIKAALVTRFRSLMLSNMTHAEMISSLFTPLMNLFEIFPLVLPKRPKGSTAIEKTAGVALAVIYRFKPCTPENGPSIKTYMRQAARQGDYNALGAKGGSTFCPAYFGETIVEGGYYHTIERSIVSSIDIRMDDSTHTNAVFLEMPWGKGDAHNGNLIRSSAPLVCDVEDINRYGLRCFSSSHPFYSTAKSTAQQVIDWELSGRAIPERLFHTIAMSNQFFNGDITLFMYDRDVRPGMWLQVAPSNLTLLEDSSSILCYVTGVSTIVSVDMNGILSEMQTIQFTRGSYGVNVPIPHNLDGPTASVRNLRATATTDWALK